MGRPPGLYQIHLWTESCSGSCAQYLSDSPSSVSFVSGGKVDRKRLGRLFFAAYRSRMHSNCCLRVAE